MPQVYHSRNRPTGGIYVGRPTPWGNPYLIGRDGDRDTVCDKFETYAKDRLLKDPSWLVPLKGKDLVCWCAPERCHADTLLRLANEGLTNG